MQGRSPGIGERNGVTGMSSFLQCSADCPSPFTFCGSSRVCAKHNRGRMALRPMPGSGHDHPSTRFGAGNNESVWDTKSTASFEMTVWCFKSFSTVFLESAFACRKAPLQRTPSHLRALRVFVPYELVIKGSLWSDFCQLRRPRKKGTGKE